MIKKIKYSRRYFYKKINRTNDIFFAITFFELIALIGFKNLIDLDTKLKFLWFMI